MIASEFIQKIRDIVYPTMDENVMKEIEDMAGKKNREEAMENYKKIVGIARSKYRENIYNIDNEFKLALFEAYDVKNNPRREKLFSLAWERGHSEGYESVENIFIDLVDLIK
jgi:hypothetical protein